MFTGLDPINYFFTDLPTLVVAMLAYSIHYALCIVLWYYAYELVCISYSRRVITQTMNPKGRWQQAMHGMPRLAA